MECKICQAPIIMSGPTGTMMVQATCKCGRVRGRVRIEGCPICGVKDTEKRLYRIILLTKKDGEGYHFTCSFGHAWSVIE